MPKLSAPLILFASLALASSRAGGADGGIAAAKPAALVSPAAPTKATSTAPVTVSAAKPGKPTAAAAAKAAKAAKAKAAKNAPVVLYHVNRRETLPLRLREPNGQPVKGLQRRMNRFLRCHHTNVQHAMNPRLARLIYQTGKHWPGHRIEVVSGYRSPKVAKNPRSPHMKGLACDFRVEGVKTAELRDYLRKTFEKVGVGYYPNSSFVHLDVRKDRSAFWIDYSGPGERSVYSENPTDDLRTGRADQYHPSKIDESWADDASKDMPPQAATPAAQGGPPNSAGNAPVGASAGTETATP